MDEQEEVNEEEEVDGEEEEDEKEEVVLFKYYNSASAQSLRNSFYILWLELVIQQETFQTWSGIF